MTSFLILLQRNEEGNGVATIAFFILLQCNKEGD
jgi:hypothetical protein